MLNRSSFVPARLVAGAASLSLLLVLIGEVRGGVIVQGLGDLTGYARGDVAAAPLRSQNVDFASGTANPLRSVNVAGSQDGSPFGYSHVFLIPAGERVASATLSIGLRAGAGGFTDTQFLAFDAASTDGSPFSGAWGEPMHITDLMPSIPAAFALTEITLDLSAAPLRSSNSGAPFIADLLPAMADGMLDVAASDGFGIDYSVLTVVTTPEPAALFPMILGALLLRRRCR